VTLDCALGTENKPPATSVSSPEEDSSRKQPNRLINAAFLGNENKAEA